MDGTSRGPEELGGLFEFCGQLGAKGEPVETRDVIGGKTQIIREPVGVVAIITPWNAPVPLTSYGVAAALIAGCTIVAKPAPETPLEAQIIAECAEAVGLRRSQCCAGRARGR